MSTILRSPSIVGRALLGALVFVAAEFALFHAADGGLGSDSAGWFLNSGRGVVVVGAALAALAVVVGLVGSLPLVPSGSALAFGAVAAMAVSLFVVGPGTIFPIVIAVGTMVITIAIAIGLALGVGVRKLGVLKL